MPKLSERIINKKLLKMFRKRFFDVLLLISSLVRTRDSIIMTNLLCFADSLAVSQEPEVKRHLNQTPKDAR